MLFLLTCCIIFVACEDKTLVTVEGKRYTIGDFTNLHQFAPTDDSLKRLEMIEEFVDQVIMIHEAQSQGYENDPVVKEAFETHRKDIIARTFYEKNVLDKVKISESDLQEHYARMVDMYHLAQIVFDQESTAVFVSAQLKQGVSFDSLLKYSLDTLTENGDIGEFSADQLPAEIFDPVSRIHEGETTEPIRFGEFFYILKVIAHTTSDQPTFAAVKEYIKNDLSRQQAMEIADKFIQKILDNAQIEYNDRGLAALIKPESLLTQDDLTTWVVKKYSSKKDSSYVYVRDLHAAVFYQYSQSRIDPKRLIDRVLIPELIYDRAVSEHYDQSSTVKEQMDRALDLLMYQKYYSDNVIEKVSVDSSAIARYYEEHREEYKDKSTDEALRLITAVLRDKEVAEVRSDLVRRLREQYHPVIHENAVQALLKEE
jgi:hypothetical protein